MSVQFFSTWSRQLDGRPGVAERHGPAAGHVGERRPQRILVLGVHQHHEGAVGVIKRIAGQSTSSSKVGTGREDAWRPRSGRI